MDTEPNNDQKKPDLFQQTFQNVQEKNNLLKNESNADWIERNIKQNIARSLESIFGMPGSMKKAYKQTRDVLGSFLPDSMPSLEKSEEELFGKREVGSGMDFLFNPPTPDELRGSVTKKFAEEMGKDKDFLEPKTPKEKKSGEVTQDLTSFFMPGAQQRMLTRIGAPVLGNLVEEGVKYLGGDDSSALKTKLGVMLATSVAGNSNPLQYGRNSLQQARNMIPQNTTVFFQPINNALQPLVTRLNRGLNVPSKSHAAQGIRDLHAQIDAQGRISLHSLLDARDNINEWIAEAGGWNVPNAVRDPTLANLNALKREIIAGIDQNLNTRFPQAAQLYRDGYEALAVTHRSQAISNFIEKYFGKKVASAGAKTLFPALTAGATVLPKTAALAGATFPLYKTGQVLYRIGQSPVLARYYTEVLRNATIANAPGMIRNLERLDKALLDEEKKKGKDEQMTLEEFKAKFMNKDSESL
jgi:hypothetical protein